MVRPDVSENIVIVTDNEKPSYSVVGKYVSQSKTNSVVMLNWKLRLMKDEVMKGAHF